MSNQSAEFTSRPTRAILLGIAISFLTGCNSVFYQPNSVIYLTPSQRSIQYDQKMLATSQGQKIAVWYLKPKLPNGGTKKGTVIQFHGNAQNMSSHFISVAWLVSHGYEVITFDYRGYGESEGIATRQNTIDDGLAIIRSVCAGQGEDDNVFIVGQSLGGAVALTSLALTYKEGKGQGDCIRGAVLESAFGSYRSMARDRLATVWLTWPLQWPLSFLVSDELSPVEYTDQIRVPIVVIYSNDDPVVPKTETQALLEGKFQIKPEIWVNPQPGHIGAFAYASGPLRERLLKWLDLQTSKGRIRAMPGE